jgi:hypothetical protein
MRKQNMIKTFACLDTELVAGYPPTSYAGEVIQDDSICEVMATAQKEIYKIYKMNGGLWYEYMVGEQPETSGDVQRWVGFPDTPETIPTREFPGQVIANIAGSFALVCSRQRFVYRTGSPNGFYETHPDSTEVGKRFILTDNEWVALSDADLKIDDIHPLVKANHDVINLYSGAIVFPRTL